MDSFSERLKGGDRRSIGNSNAVVQCVLQKPDRFGELWACLRNGDPLVRMRAADALEKISRVDVSFFEGKKKELLGGELEDGTSELRWHLIAMTARLPLDAGEARQWFKPAFAR